MLAPPEAALVRRDPAIPGLALVLDTEAMADALHRSGLFTAPTPLHMRYLRYRPGVTCLAGFSVGEADAEVGVYVKAYAVGLPVKDMAAVADDYGRNPAPLVLESERISVFPWPADARLSVLERLSPSGLPDLLPGSPELAGAALEALRYKPERRFVAGLALDGTPRAALKACADAGFSDALRGTLTASVPELRTARLLARSERDGLLLFDWLDGDILSTLLADPAVEPSVLEPVGAALAALHRRPGRGLRIIPRHDEAEGALNIAGDAAILAPALAGDASALALRLAQELRAAVQRTTPIHGDFQAGKVLVGAGSVAVLDFDRAARSDPAADVGLFIAHLQCEALRGKFSPDRVRALSEALLRGYAAAGPAPDPAWVAFYTALNLFRLCTDPFRHRESEWPDRMHAVLRRVADYLALAVRPTSVDVAQSLV